MPGSAQLLVLPQIRNRTLLSGSISNGQTQQLGPARSEYLQNIARPKKGMLQYQPFALTGYSAMPIRPGRSEEREGSARPSRPGVTGGSYGDSNDARTEA
jgi:hypothetical protein